MKAAAELLVEDVRAVRVEARVAPLVADLLSGLLDRRAGILWNVEELEVLPAPGRWQRKLFILLLLLLLLLLLPLLLLLLLLVLVLLLLLRLVLPQKRR